MGLPGGINRALLLVRLGLSAGAASGSPKSPVSLRRGRVGSLTTVMPRAAPSALGISSTGNTWSTAPNSIALWGIENTTLVASSWAMVFPPASWIAFIPSAPSDCIPVRMIPTA